MRLNRLGLAAAIGVAATAWGFAVILAQEPPQPQILVLTGQAHRVLSLVYRAHQTELMGCMIGELRGDTVRVERIGPADVDPEHSTPEHVLPRQTCEGAGWAPVVGMIHSHTSPENCWYFFPGTRVPTSDGQSFLRSSYPVDAILCGSEVVWINRAMEERRHPLPAPGRSGVDSTESPR